MPAEQQLWEGKPSLKILTVDLIWALLFGLAVAIGVALVFTPALAAVAKLSTGTARAIASNAPGLRLAAIVFVVVVAGQRIVRLAWRGFVLRALSYRLSDQRLLIESGVFSRTINEIDLRTVDDLTFHQRFSERLLDLGRIGIVSSEPGPDGGRPGPTGGNEGGAGRHPRSPRRPRADPQRGIRGERQAGLHAFDLKTFAVAAALSQSSAARTPHPAGEVARSIYRPARARGALLVAACQAPDEYFWGPRRGRLRRSAAGGPGRDRQRNGRKPDRSGRTARPGSAGRPPAWPAASGTAGTTGNGWIARRRRRHHAGAAGTTGAGGSAAGRGGTTGSGRHHGRPRRHHRLRGHHAGARRHHRHRGHHRHGGTHRPRRHHRRRRHRRHGTGRGGTTGTARRRGHTGRGGTTGTAGTTGQRGSGTCSTPKTSRAKPSAPRWRVGLDAHGRQQRRLGRSPPTGRRSCSRTASDQLDDAHAIPRPARRARPGAAPSASPRA